MSLVDSFSHEQRQKVQNALDSTLAMLQKISLMSEEDVFQAVSEHLGGLGLSGWLVRWNGEGQALSIRLLSKEGEDGLEEIRLGSKSKLFQEVIENNQGVFVDRIQSLFEGDHIFDAGIENAPSVLCPLNLLDDAPSVIMISGKILEEDDLEFLEIFSNYVTIGIENSRLIRKLNKQFEEEYQGLFENLPIGFFRVDRNGQFLLANPAFMNIFGMDELVNYDPDWQRVGNLQSVDGHSKVIDRLIETGQVDSVVTEWKDEAGRRVFLKENIRAAYDKEGNLLYYEGSVEDVTQQRDTEERLTRQLDELKLLNEVASAGASTTNIDDFLERVTEIFSQSIFLEHFGVWLYDPAIKKLRTHPSYWGISKEFAQSQTGIGIGEGVVGTVFETVQPLYVQDVRKVDNYICENPNILSELCVPIKAGGQVFGVLNAEREYVNAFTEEDEFLLTTIAGQMASALERGKFVTEVENQANQLSLLNQATLTTSRILEPDELIQLIAKQIIDLFNPDSFSITLFDEKEDCIEIAIAVEDGSIDHEKSGVKIPFSQGGLMTLLRDTGDTLQIDDLENSPLLVGYHQFSAEMRGSWLGIPLVSGKKILGALTVQYFENKIFDADQTQFLESLAAHASIAINNGRLFDEIQTRYRLNNHLSQLSEALTRPQTVEKMIETIGKSAISLVNADAAGVYVRQGDQANCAWSHGLHGENAQKLGRELATKDGKQLIDSQSPILIPDVSKLPEDSPSRKQAELEGLVSIAIWPLVYEGQTIAALGCYRRESYTYTDDEKEVMMGFARQAAVSLENARLLEAERSRRMEAEALYKTTLALTSSLDHDRVLSNILVELYRVIDYYAASLHLLDGDLIKIVAAEGLHILPEKFIGREYSANVGFIREMVAMKTPVIVDDIRDYPEALQVVGMPNVRGWIGVPLVVSEEVIGFLAIVSDRVSAFDESHATQAVAFANQAAIAIETARLFGQTQRRLHGLQSIHAIDQAISSNLDINITLEVFVEQALNLLDVEGIKVFGYDVDAQMFDLLAQRDLLSKRQSPADQFYHPDLVKRCIFDREIVRMIDRSENSPMKGNIRSYFVAPLITKGQVRGVLEVFGSGKISPSSEWLDLLNTLATQAAISIENDELISSLQKSNDELITAYDRTLEGWAYALELRDRETIGHARRVTELTVRLARTMGIKGAELANIRRGTLLHDIGKMGLPDSVLLKHGPLDKDEEKLMKTHPQLAYDMLSTIPYLRLALDIPYYHHEKWDGTGYPQGLKGEEIPLAARIFSVVDVWDAVIYDRPYREAWEKEKAIAYILSESGKHFDPQVVQKFMELIESTELSR